MANMPEDDITQTNIFYRLHYQTVMIVLLTAVFVLIAMAIFLFYQILHRPLPSFYATSTNNKKLELMAYNEPNLLPSTILRWANKAAVASYTFDFANYKNQTARARPYYTANGWTNYNNSLSPFLKNIIQQQLFVNSVVSGPSIIANEGDFPGEGYIWRTQIPFLVTYKSAQREDQHPYFVLITVVKIPTNQDPHGIGIDQFVMK